jgi:type-F conjugative transfer system pilin assembly protein TrbC
MLHALVLSFAIIPTSLMASPLKEMDSAVYINQKRLNHASFSEGQKLAKEMLAASPAPALNTFQSPPGAGEKTGCPLQWLAGGGSKPEKGNLKGQPSVGEKGAVETQDSSLYVFVSFSMPLHAIKELALQAEKHQAQLIVCGLVDNSFKKTVQKLAAFQSGLEINPTLFKEFKVKNVPTFVLLEKGQEKNRLSGNVSLTYAAEQLKGDV